MIKKSLIIDDESIDAIEGKILSELRSRFCRPHDKILSKRKLAHLLEVSPTKIYSAITKLVEKQYLYTKPRSGFFVGDKFNDAQLETVDKTPETPFAFSTFSNSMTLNLGIKVRNDPDQTQMWRNALDVFTEKYPFINISHDFNASYEDIDSFDIFLTTPYELIAHCEQFTDITGQTAKLEGLTKGIIQTGSINNQIFGVPLLRSPGVISINKTIFDEFDLDANAIKQPVDIFKLGALAEKKTKNTIMGNRYLGFCYHASLYGVSIEREDNRILFNKELAKQFLTETKPYICKHHFRDHRTSGISSFLNGEYAIYPHFASDYFYQNKSDFELIQIKIPKGQTGFVCEGMFLGAINKSSYFQDEAWQVLKYLVSKESQKQLVNDSPNWLSVRSDVLEQQKRESPFPHDAILYDFDMRSYYTQIDSIIYQKYGTKVNIEAGKFYTGLQSLDETIRRIGYV